MKNIKKILIGALSALLCISMVACSNDGDKGDTTTTTTTTNSQQTTTAPAGNDTTTAPAEETTPVAESAHDLFQKIWAAYMADTSIPEEMKLGFVMGGDEKWNETVMAKQDEFFAKNPNPTEEEMIAFNNSISGPGEVGITNVDFLTSLSFPTDKTNLLVSASCVMNAMNRNQFTGGVYETKNADDAKALAEALKASIPATQWVCGFPDLYTVITVDNYVIALFGANQIDPDFGNYTPVADVLKVIEGMFDNETVLCKEALF